MSALNPLMDVCFKAQNISVNAGSTYSTPNIFIAPFRLKTISIIADYSMHVVVEVSDDGVNWYTYYEDTLRPNKLWSKSFEETYKYMRLRITNPDSTSHNIIYLSVKGK